MTEKEGRPTRGGRCKYCLVRNEGETETEGQRKRLKTGYEARRREVDLLRIDYQNDEIGDGERGGRRRSFVAVY